MNDKFIVFKYVYFTSLQILLCSKTCDCMAKSIPGSTDVLLKTHAMVFDGLKCLLSIFDRLGALSPSLKLSTLMSCRASPPVGYGADQYDTCFLCCLTSWHQPRAYLWFTCIWSQCIHTMTCIHNTLSWWSCRVDIGNIELQHLCYVLICAMQAFQRVYEHHDKLTSWAYTKYEVCLFMFSSFNKL